MYNTIFLVKETRHGEKRVSLIPKDVAALIQSGSEVIVEDHAGYHAGYKNSDYEQVGATICKLKDNRLESYRAAFERVSIIVRAKRPDRNREKLENLAIRPGTKMVGSLDLLEKNSDHLMEYHAAGIEYYSFDQFNFPPGSPISAMEQMSVFAGRLALEDAIKKLQHVPRKVIVIGYGNAGRAAHEACIERELSCTVFTGQQYKIDLIKSSGGDAVFLNHTMPLEVQQRGIIKYANDADIIVTAASKNGVVAPILITEQTLLTMKPGSVIVDLAVSEGGNVAGSQADSCLVLGNNIYVMNVSGYPKLIPIQSSILWSKASYYFLNTLIQSPESLIRLRRDVLTGAGTCR